jgi:hypothetical protein
MPPMTPRVLLLLSIASAVAAQTPGQLAIRNVTVIPMGSERVIPNATVVIRDGRIASVGSTASTAIPRGALTIDGTGKFRQRRDVCAAHDRYAGAPRAAT